MSHNPAAPSRPVLFPDPAALRKKFEGGVSLLAWAYNEEESIEIFVRRAVELMRAVTEDFEIVLVDDGSRDGTAALLSRLAVEIPQLRVLTNEVNRQVNYSWHRSIRAASKEYLFWQTVDWSYDVSELRKFLELLRTYDVVMGVRRAPVEQRAYFSRKLESLLRLVSIRHLTARSDTVSKALISICNYCLIRLLFRIPLSDYHNVMICPTRLIQALKFESRGSFPEPIIKLYWSGASVVEVPIAFLPRQRGVAKGTRLPALFKAARDVFSLWFRWVVLQKCEPKRPVPVRRLNLSEWAEK